MKKMSLLALLLAVMMIMSGCSLLTVDKELDNARVIVDVNGETIDKATVNAMIDYEISQNDYTNQMSYLLYGMSAGLPTDRETILPTVLNNYVNNLVAQQKVKELGLDQLTEEEQAQVQQMADEEYAAFLNQVATNYLINEGLEEEELTARAEEYAKENNLGELADYVESATIQMGFDKLEAYAVKDVVVTEEELIAALNEKALADEMAYAADLYSYVDTVNDGVTVYYSPAGLRYVKHILVMFTEEDNTILSEKYTAQVDAQSALTAAQTALDGAGEDADLEALNVALFDAQIALDEAATALNEAKVIAAANIKEKADEIYALATAEGADFDALAEEYNEDTGYLYVVGAEVVNYVAPFTEASMALEAIGDVSEPVLTDYGYHILQYSGDVAEGPADLEDVRDELHADTLADKQAQVFGALMDTWVAEAQVKTYPERMD